MGRYERSVWAGGLLLRDERILMVHNCWPDAQVWGLPGGYSPPGESLRETVRRELCEEAGLELEGSPEAIGELAIAIENFWPPDERGIRSHAFAFVFHIQAAGEPMGPQDPDGWVREVRWVPVDELEVYLEPVRRAGWCALWEPLTDYVHERWSGARFYEYA